MSQLTYKTKGQQTSYYLVDGEKIDGTILEADTVLYLRNKECHLLDVGNIFEIAQHDDDDIYIILDADQVEYVDGNPGERDII